MPLRALAEAPGSYTRAPETLTARQWFQDAKFGIFLHRGLYSELGGGGKMGIAEWVMNDEQIPARPDYFPRGTTGHGSEWPAADEWDRVVRLDLAGR